MASASVPARATARPPWETIVAVAAVVSLALWPIEIHRAFGLPAHPLLIHVPVVFVPLLGLAVLAVALRFRWFERYGVLVAAFSVVTLAATNLAVGAGEAFLEDRQRAFGGVGGMVDPMLADHRDAGTTLRLALIVLTATLVGLLFARRLPNAGTIVLRVLAALFALVAIFFVIRTGHLGAKLAWSREGDGPPAGFDGGGQGFPGGQAPPGGAQGPAATPPAGG
ncbi:MAG TPA: DUF2231 domain-containing protein [Solirubrobacter sp.]|nr:DUF2231 domain-containing protein [Solirubrobacter sp.]